MGSIVNANILCFKNDIFSEFIYEESYKQKLTMSNVPDLVVSKLRAAFLTPKTELKFRPSKFVEKDSRWYLQKELLIESYEQLAKQIESVSDDELRKYIEIIYGIPMSYCNEEREEREDPKSINRYEYVIYVLRFKTDQMIPIESSYRIYSPFSDCPAARSDDVDKPWIQIDSNTDLLHRIANTQSLDMELNSQVVNIFDYHMGNYPLTLAISKGYNHYCNRRKNQFGQKLIIEQLLPFADLQLREFRYGLTPLEIAIMRGDDINLIENLFKLGSNIMPLNLETLLTLDYETVKIRIVRMTCYNFTQTYERTATCTISDLDIFLQNRELIRAFFSLFTKRKM